MIVLDLCQPHHQVLLISYLKFTKRGKGCEERRKIKPVSNFSSLENNKLNCKCKECKTRWLIPINELIKKFPNVYEFSNGDINKFVLLLRKGIYPYEYMDSWERFDEASLLDKKAFYNKLHLENITDDYYTHAQKVFKKLKLKSLDDYHDLYVQSDTLLLADVFENFRNKCIEIYELDSAHFLSAPGLAWQACLKKIAVRLKFLTDIDMFLMVEKEIRGRICHAIHRYAKANNKYKKDYDKNIESSYVVYSDANNLYGWGMSEKWF